ncbi:MAG TPA: glycosyltransferase family 4 protein [Gemmatimonadota bacterium]|nr:glycosyltransferase family 4 protein [Gemmatimonadota bacterium]
MRVLLITDWMRNWGGAEWYTTAIREGLRARGHDARLLTSDVAPEARATADYLARGSTRMAAQAFLQVVNPFAAAAVRRAVGSFRPDVVHLAMIEHHLSPAVLAVLGDVPAVLTVQDYKLVCPTSWKLLPDGAVCTQPAGAVCWRGGCVGLPHWLRDRPRYRLLERGIGRLDRVLACSRTVQAELARGGIAADVLAHPVRAPGPGFRRRPAAEPVFVFLGRLSREKGLSLLLRAFAAIGPGARLRIVGRGPEGPGLERLARELGIAERVTFTGWVPPEEVERELADAWALVAPSLHSEPLGLVALEAIVRGVPVIASALGGFAETIEEGTTGLLFPNGDGPALSAAMEAVAADRAFPERGIPPEAARRAAEEHDLGRHVEALVEIYRGLTERGRRGAA